MSETHVISALRAKRLEIAAHVHDTEKKLAKLRASLANLDAAMTLLTPGHPDAVPPRRGYRRTKYFARNELPRLTLDALRKAAGPITAGEIAAGAIRDKGLPASTKEAVTEMVLGTLRGLVRRGTAVKIGSSRNARWAIPRSENR
jgi:hypothetical protein